MMPGLLYERLDDLGLDFCVVYPTAALGWYRLPSEKHRRALCRAYNTFTAEQFRPYNDRIIPAAIIPMYSPEEAIDELTYVSTQLGLRVLALRGPHRPLGEAEDRRAREHEPGAARSRRHPRAGGEIREARGGRGDPAGAGAGRQRQRHGRRRGSGRLLALQDHAQGR